MPAYFVIGPPRSGTTLLLDLLRRHPEVTAHGEDFHLFHHDLLLFRERQAREDHFHLTTADASAELKERYRRAIAAAQKASGRSNFVLKISTLSQQVDYVKALCPEARFIQLTRDGRDAACSMEDLRRALEKEQGHPRELGPAPDPFGLWCSARGFPKLLCAAASWYYHVTRSFLDLRFAGADSFLRLRYEDLVAQPAASVSRVLQFMGLPPAARVERVLRAISDAPGEAGGLGFSTCQAAGGRRLRRFEVELPSAVRIAIAPLLASPMRLLGYEPDPVPGETALRSTCSELGVDAGVWKTRVEIETAWFGHQVRLFAPETLLKQADAPLPISRPLLVDGAMAGSTVRFLDGAILEGTSFVAKQNRRMSFADRDSCWPKVAASLNGESTVAELEQRFTLGPEGAAILTRLHGLGFVSYA